MQLRKYIQYIPTIICAVLLAIDGMAHLVVANVRQYPWRIVVMPLRIIVLLAHPIFVVIVLLIDPIVVRLLEAIPLVDNYRFVESGDLLGPSSTLLGWLVASLIILILVGGINYLVIRCYHAMRQ